MKTYEVLINFEQYRVGQIVLVAEDWRIVAWDALAASGYVHEHPLAEGAPATMERIQEFLANPETGVKRKRPRRRTEEVPDGEDQAEPGPGASGGTE